MNTAYSSDVAKCDKSDGKHHVLDRLFLQF